MKNIGLIIIALITVSLCSAQKTMDEYLVNATIKNIPDSTRVLLYLFPKTHIAVDSTRVLNGKFRFRGKVNRPKLAHIRMPDVGEGRTFWLENNDINIAGERGSFLTSQISGSGTQKQAEILAERKDSIFAEMKKLEAQVNDENRDSLFTIYEEMTGTVVDIEKEFIKDFPDSYESLYRLNSSKGPMGRTETARLLSLLSPELRSTEEGKVIEEFVKINTSPEVGDPYADFEQENVKGIPVKLSSELGKYTLVEFWASWCGPCRSFNPELVELYHKYNPLGFNILSVSLDTEKERWIKAIEKDGLPWSNVSDLKGLENQAALIYGVRDIPDNFLIDENGTIVARYLRGKQLKEKLKELFTN